MENNRAHFVWRNGKRKVTKKFTSLCELLKSLLVSVRLGYSKLNIAYIAGNLQRLHYFLEL